VAQARKKFKVNTEKPQSKLKMANEMNLELPIEHSIDRQRDRIMRVNPQQKAMTAAE
jgi:hypothetical protein